MMACILGVMTPDALDNLRKGRFKWGRKKNSHNLKSNEEVAVSSSCLYRIFI